MEGPELFSRGSVNSVKLGIAAAEVNDTIGDSGRRLDAHLIVNLRVLAGFEAPFFFSSGSIESIEKAVPAADEQRALGNGRRGVDDVAGFEFPFQIARSGVERVNIGVTAAEIDAPFETDRRRKVEIERVWHGFSGGFRAVEMRGGVAALARRLEFPFQLAAGGINSVEVAVEASEIDNASADGRRRSNAAIGLEFPLERASGGVERIEKVVAAANIQYAVRRSAGEDNIWPFVRNCHLIFVN